MAKDQAQFKSVKALNDSKKKSTEFHIRDKVYNSIIDRYSKHDHEFNFGDEVVWGGSIYQVPDYFSYIVFFALFYWIGDKLYAAYGIAHVFMFFALLGIWRVNMLLRSVKKIQRDVAAQVAK